VLLGLLLLGAFRPLELFFARTVTPISQILYGASIYVSPGYQANTVNELIIAYNELEKELADNRVDAALLTDALYENERLREQLKFVRDRSFDRVGADVIGRQVDPSESTLIINVGTDNGVAMHMPVITGNGILIGTIAKVSETYALVRLLTDSQSSVAATINSDDRSIGVVQGGFGISVQMNLIPQNERIVPRDVVITSGLTEGIPRGLLIGMVESVQREAYQPFQRAVITTPVRLDKVTVVSVITGV
jgi:rod shape-determining protein MreC